MKCRYTLPGQNRNARKDVRLKWLASRHVLATTAEFSKKISYEACDYKSAYCCGGSGKSMGPGLRLRSKDLCVAPAAENAGYYTYELSNPIGLGIRIGIRTGPDYWYWPRFITTPANKNP